jgi:putrescine transport system substrate-binding protein
MPVGRKASRRLAQFLRCRDGRHLRVARCAASPTPHPPATQKGLTVNFKLSSLVRAAAIAVGASALLATVTAHAAPAAAKPMEATEPKVLNIYNWSDYIADDTIKNFEKETGIKVRYDNYDNNEILHTKLVAGKTGYDIVVPSGHFAKTQIEGGLFRPLDRALLTNWGNLDPAILAQMAAVDPGNKFLVDWLWGFVTVGINAGKVKKALGDMPS